MRYLSVCSGIEAATVAWHPLGWEAAAFSEIEKFPRAVLQHHYPDVPLHGDFTTIGAEEYGPIDLLVGGTPCQSFSVAGLRAGLGDDRGNLALEFLRLAERTSTRWVVWENVPGVLSSNGGRDFGSILGGMVELGYGFAYRVLDAQFFGVAQRRRRVFVVGRAGSAASAAAVLFERHSLQGHSAPCREAREGIAGSTEKRAANSHWPADVAPTLNAAFGSKMGLEDQHALNGAGCFVPSLIGGWDYENNAHGPDDPTGPLLKGSPTGGGRPLPAIAFSGQMSVPQVDFDLSQTLQAKNPQAVAFPIDTQNMTEGHNSGGKGFGAAGDPSFTLTKGHSHAVGTPCAVRRLTPVECERLQGFPDDYTKIPWRGKDADQCPDGPRYKALGNSMAVPVMRWIGERIDQVEAIAQRKAA